MSNYRVRQLRFLVALATWMTDETRMVRVGFETLIEDTGSSRNTVRNARRELETARKLASKPGTGRGHLTVWTVLCLPQTAGKEASEVNPVSEVDPLTARKGVNEPSERGSTSTGKGGQPETADLRVPDRGLNRLAKPSSSGAAAPARGAGMTVNYYVSVAVPPAVNPAEAGRQVAEVLLAHTRNGGRLYPNGMTPR